MLKVVLLRTETEKGMLQGLRLVQTSEACPEQYEFYDGDREVGYLRLRYGYFTVTYPDVNGRYVYEATIGHEYLGEFESDADRDLHLNLAAEAIKRAMKADGESR